jgi:O-antigen/teichoic acid export membrane protein
MNEPDTSGGRAARSSDDSSTAQFAGRLRRDTAITMVTQILAVLSGFGLTLVAARSLTLTEFAVVSWALSWTLQLGTIAAFGSGQSSVIVAAQAGRARIGAALPKFVVLITLCSAITVVLWVLVIGPLAWEETDDAGLYRSAAPAIALWIPTVAVAGLVGGLMRGLAWFGPAALVSEYLRRTILIVVLLTIGIAADVGVGSLLIIGAGVELFVLLCSAEWLRRRLQRFAATTSPDDPARVWALSAPFVLPAAAAVVVPHAGIWIAAAAADSAATADFAIAIRFSLFFYVPQIAGLRVLGPRVAAAARENDLGRIEPMLRGFASVSTVVTGVFAAGFAIAGQTMLVAAFGEEFRSAYAATMILIFAGVVNSATGLSGVALSHTGHEVYWSRTALAAIVVFPAAAFALSPHGALGLAIAAAGVMIARNLLVAAVTSRLTGITALPTLDRTALRGALRSFR